MESDSRRKKGRKKSKRQLGSEMWLFSTLTLNYKELSKRCRNEIGRHQVCPWQELVSAL